MGENIFALQLSQPQPQQVTPPGYGNVPFEDGLRAIMTVNMIFAKVQTTVLFGDSLFMLSYDIGQLTKQDGFRAFIKAYFNHPITGAQLSQPPFAATPAYYLRANQTASVSPPAPPVAKGKVTMLDAGFDPLRGYWIEFAGNYWLHFPLFKNWPTVIRDAPGFKGFQPSANNPGGSGPGGSTPGSGTPPQNC
jgi:hypothetical protein